MGLFKFGHSLVDKMRQLFKEDLPSHVISGMTAPTDAGLTHTITSGVASVDGYRIALSATGHTYTASRDTYVDLSIIGVLTFVEVANGAGEPGITADSMRFLKVVTDGTAITASDRFKGTGILNSGVVVPLIRLRNNANTGDIFDVSDMQIRGTVPMASVRTGTQTITTSVNTALTFSTEDIDTDAIHDLATNTGRLTAKTAGKYLVEFQVSWAANATGARTAQIAKNGVGTSPKAMSIVAPVPGSNQTIQGGSYIINLAVNDYVEVEVFQDSGGNLDVAATETHFSMHWIGE